MSPPAPLRRGAWPGLDLRTGVGRGVSTTRCLPGLHSPLPLLLTTPHRYTMLAVTLTGSAAGAHHQAGPAGALGQRATLERSGVTTTATATLMATERALEASQV